MKQRDSKDTRALEQIFLFLKMKLYLANISEVIVSAHLHALHAKIFKQHFPKAQFAYSPDSILDHLLSLGLKEKFIKDHFFEKLTATDVALLTREKILEKFENLKIKKTPTPATNQKQTEIQ